MQFLDGSTQHDNLAYSAAYLVTKRKIYFRKRLVERFRDRNGQNARLEKCNGLSFSTIASRENIFLFIPLYQAEKLRRFDLDENKKMNKEFK